MAKYGFLSVLEEELDKNFNYNYEINWDKRNFAVEVSFLLEVENKNNVVLTDKDETETDENILFEDAILFYDPKKSKFDSEDYLAAYAYTEKGFSREFLTYLAQFLNETTEQGLDDLIDFLEADVENESDSETSEDDFFELKYNAEEFEKGLASITEGEFFKYPRY